MTNYELLYIVSNQYTEEELTAIRAKINALVAENSGIIGYQEFLGKKKLAYPINNVNHGYYVAVEFESEDSSALKNITNKMRLNKEILRAQIIIRPKLSEADRRREKPMEDTRPADSAAEARTAPIERKTTKIKTKNLDEKLDEILKQEEIL